MENSRCTLPSPLPSGFPLLRAHGQLLSTAIVCQVQAPGAPTVNRMPDPAFPHSDASGRLMAHGMPVRRQNMRGWKELRGLITQLWGTMQITDCLGEVTTIMPSQARSDAGFESWKNIPSTRSTGPTALKAVIKFPNCWALKTSICPCVAWHHMARREKRSFSDHPVRKAKDSSG